MQEVDPAAAPLRRLAHVATMAGAKRAPSRVEPPATTAAAAPARPEPVPQPEPEPLPESEPDPEPMPQPEPEPAPERELPEIGEETEATEEAPLSDEDIERILNAQPEPEPDVVQSLVDVEPEEQEAVHPEDIPDPEPLPEVFTATERVDFEETGGGRKGLWRALIALFALVALGAGLYFARANVMAFWPATESVYAMVGLERLGAGLELIDVRNEWANEGEQKDLVVTGAIANTSDRDRSVPMLRIELRDGRDEVVQVYVHPPEKTRLAAGERLTFRAHVGEVMKTARRTHVMWTEELPPDAANAAAKPAG